MPLTLIEAMASGLPVIATDVGGTSEALSKEWLYKPHEIDRLKYLIRRIYEMPSDRRKEIGLHNRKIIIEKFNIRKNAKKIIKLVNNLI